MRTLTFQITVAAALILALLATGFGYRPGMTQADPASTGEADTMSIAFPAQQAQAAGLQLTRAARLAAEPMPLPQVSAADLALQAAEDAAAGDATGDINFSVGGQPDPHALATAKVDFAEEWQDPPNIPSQQSERVFLPNILRPGNPVAGAAAGEIAPASVAETFGTKGIYTSYAANYYTPMHLQFPYIAVGRLFFSGGSCSASVISPNNVIVTAAHCVFNTDRDYWYSNFLFVPAYRNGWAPLGVFPATDAVILTAYAKAKTASKGSVYDIAMLKLGTNSAGRSVTYYTGWLGMAANIGYSQSLHAMGYPSNLLGANYSYVCAAESYKKGTDILGMGCNMMHGSSGGPWLLGFAPYSWGNVNYVGSVVSFGVQDSTWGNTFYGPRFTSGTIGPLCRGIGC